MRWKQPVRTGATLVESALVYPIVILLVLGLLVGGWGIFRHQELASVARRAARYAAVHGTAYAKDTGKTAATPSDIYNIAIDPYLVGFDRKRVTYAITYNTDNSPYHTKIVNGDTVAVGNTVSVTINYKWLPEAFLGEIKLTSTSVVPMSY